MNPEEIRAAAGPSWARRPVECHGTLPSTNDRALQLLGERGRDAHLTAVFADSQTAGRGRQGRAWHSSRGRSLTLTLLVASGPTPAAPGLLPLTASLAVADALRETAGLEARLRWPNDVDAGGRKIAGVLVEGRWRGSEPEGFAVGIGVNLGEEEADFPPELREIATSVRAQARRDISPTLFAGSLLRHFEARLEELISSPSRLLDGALPLWDHAGGQTLEVLTNGETVRGRFAGVGPSGELLLDLPGGGRRALVQGEVARVRPGREGDHGC